MKALKTVIVVLIIQNIAAQRKKEGDDCVDDYTNIVGTCTGALKCESAKLDYQRNGIKPTFCFRSTFRESLLCCKDGKTILQTANSNANRRPVWTSGDTGNQKRISERKCEDYSKGVTMTIPITSLLPEPESKTISIPRCNYAGIELIVGGESASLNEFPHMAALGWVTDNNEYEFVCGGALISERFVLTAGHCTRRPRVRNPTPSIVRLGDHNIDPTVDDGANTIDVPIRNIIKHPNYRPPRRYNDIALLELAADVEFNNGIRPACLWKHHGFPGLEKGIATGWGVNNTITKTVAKELQKVSLTLLENGHCDRLLISKRSHNWGGFASSQMCAGELRGKQDTCQGDSGGPLQVTATDNQCIFYLIGVTSFGTQCAVSGRPAIYTRVSSYLEWIERTVWPEN